MKNSKKIQRMVGISSLAAITAILQVFSNYIKIGPVNITLALIPVSIGAILYGPLAGFGLGILLGVVVLTAPDTALFWNFNPWLTFFLCLLKTALAGMIVGVIFKTLFFIKSTSKLCNSFAVILSTLLTPILNTLFFIIGTSLLFRGLSITSSENIIVLLPTDGTYGEILKATIGFVIITNFLVEFIVCAVLSPSIIYLIKILARNSSIGIQDIFDRKLENEIGE